MNPLLSNALDELKVKVSDLVSKQQSLEKELKKLQIEKTKLETALHNALANLESEKNKTVASGLAENQQDREQLIKQLDKYIKLIDTSIAQVKSGD